jgi:hypothetical protein
MTSSAKSYEGEEKRGAARRRLLESFSMAVVLPEKGCFRLAVHDVSEQGVGFDFKIGGKDYFGLKKGDALPLHLYLNQNLYLPLRIKIARLDTHGQHTQVGAEIVAEESEGFASLVHFLEMLDAIPASVQLG